MQILRYFNHNGIIFPEDQNVLHHSNRGFAYGDGFFETMHANGMEVQFYHAHWQRIKMACSVLIYQLPLEINDDGNGLKTQIIKLLHRNRFFQGVRVRVTFYRNSGGYYYPAEQKLSYLIQLEKLVESKYVLNKIGYQIDICNDIYHPKLPWSGFKTLNSLVYIQAAEKARRMELDDCIFADKSDYLIEGVAANLMLIKNTKIYTPPLSEGCVDGVMRNAILKLAPNIGMSFKEKRLKTDEMLAADEIWLSNAITGIRWVRSFRTSRFFHAKAELMTNEINKYCFS